MFLNNVIFHFYVGGEGGKGSMTVMSKHRSCSSAGNCFFFYKCQTKGVGGQVVQGVDLNYNCFSGGGETNFNKCRK